VGFLDFFSSSGTDEEKLCDLVRNGQMFATISFNSILDEFPELDKRANQINVDDYDYLYTVAWVFCGTLLIGRDYVDGLPKHLQNIPFDRQRHNITPSNDSNLKSVGDVLERRWERWFDQGIGGYNDLTKFVENGLRRVQVHEQTPAARDFLIGQWFLWNLFGEKPDWASIGLTQTLGGVIMRGATSTLE
jgi:hypothetical protein